MEPFELIVNVRPAGQDALYIVLHTHQDCAMHQLVTGLKQQCNQVCVNRTRHRPVPKASNTNEHTKQICS